MYHLQTAPNTEKVNSHDKSCPDCKWDNSGFWTRLKMVKNDKSKYIFVRAGVNWTTQHFGKLSLKMDKNEKFLQFVITGGRGQ